MPRKKSERQQMLKEDEVLITGSELEISTEKPELGDVESEIAEKYSSSTAPIPEPEEVTPIATEEAVTPIETVKSVETVDNTQIKEVKPEKEPANTRFVASFGGEQKPVESAYGSEAETTNIQKQWLSFLSFLGESEARRVMSGKNWQHKLRQAIGNVEF